IWETLKALKGKMHLQPVLIQSKRLSLWLSAFSAEPANTAWKYAGLQPLTE
ncbi:hypothetical protein ABG768_008194, partial [Culter alburnus]